MAGDKSWRIALVGRAFCARFEVAQDFLEVVPRPERFQVPRVAKIDHILVTTGNRLLEQVERLVAVRLRQLLPLALGQLLILAGQRHALSQASRTAVLTG